MNIEKAKAIRGWMNHHELWWLAEQAKKANSIIEVGCAWGRSTRALCDNTDGFIYAIDTWNGSPNELLSTHVDFKEQAGDSAYLGFCENLWDQIKVGFVLPLRMDSLNAARFLNKRGIKSPFIFIDGCHDEEAVYNDIQAYRPLVEAGGILAGHDYNDPHWGGVNAAIKRTDLTIELPLPHIWVSKL